MPVNIELRADVADLLYREANLLDRRDWESWLELYTEDAVFWAPSWVDEETTVDEPEIQLNLLFLEGRGKLEDRVFRIESRDSYASLPLDRTVHIISNITVNSATDETVDASANGLTHSFGKHGRQTSGCLYEFMLRRTADGLRIARKKIILIDDGIAGPIDIYHL